MASVFINQTSFIDQSLKELDSLIKSKREDMQRLDALRKSRSPGSFSIDVSPRLSRLSVSPIESRSVRASPNVMTNSVFASADKENQQQRANVNVQLVEDVATMKNEKEVLELKSPLSVRIQSSRVNSSLKSSPVPVSVPVPPPAIESVGSVSAVDDMLVMDAISRALDRIEQLEHDREDYAKYIQRLNSDTEELVQVIEAQRGVINALTMKTQHLEQDNNNQLHISVKKNQQDAQHQRQQSAASVSASKTSGSTSTSTGGGTKRTMRRRSPGAQSPVEKICSSSSVGPFSLGMRSSDVGSPDFPVSHNSTRSPPSSQSPSSLSASSPSSIFIIRHQMPSPVLTMRESNFVKDEVIVNTSINEHALTHVQQEKRSEKEAQFFERESFTIAIALYLFILVILGYVLI